MAASSEDDAAKRRRTAVGPGHLLPELLANINDRLSFLDRIALAAVFGASCDDDEDVLKPCTPWLILPSEENNNPATATLFSVTDRRAATVRAPDPALRGHSVLGSSRGWLATFDVMGQIYVVNPATGEQHALPDITTMGSFLSRGNRTFTSDEMRGWFYRKVVLLSTPRRRGSSGAMLILDLRFGAPAFATSEDVAWRLAPSRDGVEDDIHHDGRFYSVTYTGVVQTWERDAESGAYTSAAVAPALTIPVEEEGSSRKYVAVTPGGRLMVAVKYVQVTKEERRWRWVDRWTCSFKVHVLGDGGQWKETRDLGDVTLFVGLNNSLCVPTRGCPEIEAGCIYFTGDELRDQAALLKRNESGPSPYNNLYGYKSHDADVRAVGVYSLKDGTVKKVEVLGQEQYRILSIPPVWITPSIP
ncbi:unnamed protein product [Alopecurus aequalis]